MTLDGVAGRLVLRPGSAEPVLCERPMVGATLLNRLSAGRRAVLLPDLLAAVFTLCAHAQRSTSRRAVRAALGQHDGEAEAAQDARGVAMHVVREHLQRLALDLPALAGAEFASPSPHWLLDAPVMALPAPGRSHEAQALLAIAEALPGWLERRLFGMPPSAWLAAWRAERGGWLLRWCHQQPAAHPVAAWLRAVHGAATAIAWTSPRLDPLREPAAGMAALAQAMSDSPEFALAPLWAGAAAETGPWTRVGEPWQAQTVWERLDARLADIARIALDPTAALSQGALTVAEGEGIAWTEMARGLLVHWVRLEEGPGRLRPDTARAERCHVLAPTEWNFHPQGRLAQWLRSGERSDAEVTLAAAALDPCLKFGIEREADPAPQASRQEAGHA
jgi:hypothetical protein